MITCAHNCFYRPENKETIDLLFIPANNGKNSTRPIKIVKSFYMKEYTDLKIYDVSQYDFAVLELE